MSVNNEVRVLRRKIAAMEANGTLLVISDLYEVIRQEIYDQTGMQLKQKGEPIDILNICKQMKGLYEQELSRLLSPHDTSRVMQKDLETEINEIKNQ